MIKPLTQADLVKGRHYRWKSDAVNTMVYMGFNWSGNGYWHQFERISQPGVIWCEITSRELEMIEETA